MKFYLLIICLEAIFQSFSQSSSEKEIIKLSDKIFQWEVNNQIDSLEKVFDEKLKIQDAMETETDKSQVLEMTRQLTTLMIDKNTVGMNKILDTQFTLTHITGYVQSKDEWYAEIESERMKYYSYKEVKTSMEIDGEKATFVGQNLLDARIWGSRNTWRLQQTMQLEKRNDKWIILKSEATIF